MSFLQHTVGDGFAITPSDTVDLPKTANCIYVGGDGDLAIETPSGVNLTFTGLVAGTVFPWKARKVLATGTTATGLIAGVTK
jgi:hypothetical protein